MKICIWSHSKNVDEISRVHFSASYMYVFPSLPVTEWGGYKFLLWDFLSVEKKDFRLRMAVAHFSQVHPCFALVVKIGVCAWEEKLRRHLSEHMAHFQLWDQNVLVLLITSGETWSREYLQKMLLITEFPKYWRVLCFLSNKLGVAVFLAFFSEVAAV